MAVERRIIWMSDEEWELLTGMAEAKGLNVSGLIRAMWADAAKAQPASLALEAEVALLTSGHDQFNSRPFTPVPKKH